MILGSCQSGIRDSRRKLKEAPFKSIMLPTMLKSNIILRNRCLNTSCPGNARSERMTRDRAQMNDSKLAIIIKEWHARWQAVRSGLTDCRGTPVLGVGVNRMKERKSRSKRDKRR